MDSRKIDFNSDVSLHVKVRMIELVSSLLLRRVLIAEITTISFVMLMLFTRLC